MDVYPISLLSLFNPDLGKTTLPFPALQFVLEKDLFLFRFLFKSLAYPLLLFPGAGAPTTLLRIHYSPFSILYSLFSVLHSP